MQANRADAIAAQAREILRTVKVQLQIAREAKAQPSRNLLTFGMK